MEPQPMTSGMSGMSGMKGQCSSCQNGGMMNQQMGGLGGGRRFFGGNCQGQSGIFQRMGSRVRGFWDRCLGEDDESYMHNNMNQMQHMNGMQHNGMHMGQMRPGMGNMQEMNS